MFAIKLTAHSGQVDWRKSSRCQVNGVETNAQQWINFGAKNQEKNQVHKKHHGNTSACQIWTLEMSRWAKCIFPAMPRTLLEWTHSVLTQTVCETPTRASDMLLEPQPVESRNFRLLFAAFYFIEMFKSYFLIFFLKKKNSEYMNPFVANVLISAESPRSFSPC